MGSGIAAHLANAGVDALLLDIVPPNLTDAEWIHGNTDGEIYTMIQNGAGGTSVMKGFKGKMPDRDMWNVVNYLRSLAAKGASR